MHIERRHVFAAIFFAVTAAAALWAIGYFSGGYARFAALAARIGPQQWLVLAAATLVFYALDYARFFTLLALLGTRVGLGLGARLTCVTYFVSSLTPTAELNVPAMILMLRLRDVPASRVAAAAMAKAIYVVVWMCLFGFVAVATGAVALPPAVAENLAVFLAPAGVVVAAFFYAMWMPQRVQARTVEWLARPSLTGWRRSLVSGVDRAVAAIAQIGASRGAWHAASHAACIAFIIAYAFIGAALCAALGIALAPERALAVFSTSLLVAYLAPTPGSIGVSEVVTAYLIDPAMPGEAMVASTLLRFLCGYVLVIPGAIVIADEIRAIGSRALRGESP